MPHRVLVPIDFKPGGEPALAWAVALVEQTGGTVEVLHVVPTAHQLDALFRPGLTPRWTVRKIRQQAAAHLSRQLPAHFRYRLHVVEGEPAATILAEAKRLRPGLIVIGTRGRGRMARLLLGSVAEKVIQGATVPVVTIPPPR
jgi:universal stress protein A